MANRATLFRPLAPDGSGDPGITRGLYAIYSAKKVKFADLGELQPTTPLIITISGAAVTKDLPVIEAGDHNALVVKGFFGPTARYPDTPSSTEYVLVPAGATVDFEDLPRVDPSTLGPVTVLTSEQETRLEAVEAAVLAGGGSATNLAGITDMTAFTRTVNKTVDAAAFRTTIGTPATAAVLPVASPTSTGTASFVNLVVSGTTSFVDGSIAQADVNGLVSALATLTTAVGAVPALSDLNHIPYYLHTVSGAYPARPDTHLTPDRVVIFDDPNVVPANTGVITGGGGMVPGLDMWIS